MSMYTLQEIVPEKQPGLGLQDMLHAAAKGSAGMLRSVKIFFGLQVRPKYRRSRIIRKNYQSFEIFIFKGYDQQTPGLSRPGSFKALKNICKN